MIDIVFHKKDLEWKPVLITGLAICGVCPPTGEMKGCVMSIAEKKICKRI